MNEPSYFNPLETICNAGFSVYLQNYSAIDSWLFTRPPSAIFHILTNAGTADLAKLFEKLRYPGAELADAALEQRGCAFYFTCVDSSDKKRYFVDKNGVFIEEKQKINSRFLFENSRASFKLLEFYQDHKTHTFYDPCNVYPLLLKIRRGFRAPEKITVTPLEILKSTLNFNSERIRAIMDAALILAKYFPVDILAKDSALFSDNAQSFVCGESENQLNEITYLLNGLHKGAVPGQEEQRYLLSALMTSANPGLGLELLKNTGFIKEYWHELSILDETDQAKEFHPEGNVWKHTMETFRYRKNGVYDLELSLGLLLHDTGKPLAVSNGSRHFDSHSELGVIQARKFLGSLGFNEALINNVCFLVRNHMITAALPRLPIFRTEEIMSSGLFPVLLELYRCDESSSFKGLDGYYESSAVYQSYLRNRHNPYRSADGKKLSRRQIIESANIM